MLQMQDADTDVAVTSPQASLMMARAYEPTLAREKELRGTRQLCKKAVERINKLE